MNNKNMVYVSLIILTFFLFDNFARADIVLFQEEFKFIDTDHPEKCYEELFEGYKDECLVWNAAYHKEEKFCELVETGKDLCYHLLAIYTKNDNFCNKIGQYEEYCITEVEAIKKRDPTICEKMENPNGCYMYVSLVFDDLDLCYKFSFPHQCIINIIHEKDDINLCKEIKGNVDNFFCYAYFAIVKKKPELCEKADTPENCYNYVAKGLLNPDLCSLTKNERDIDDCTIKVRMLSAISKGDPSECELSGWWKESCYEKVALSKELKKNVTNIDIDFSSLNPKKEKNDITTYIIIGIIIVIILFLLFIKKIVKRDEK